MRTFFIFFVFFVATLATSAQTIPFTESFENGIAKWNNASSGGTVEATMLQALVGSKSLHITGTGASAGVSLDFTTSQEPGVIFYYVRVAGGEGGVVAVGNGHSTANAAFYGEITGGNFVVTGNAGATILCPVASNEWVKVEVKNLNYIAMTYDVYINGVLMGKGLPFRNSVPGISTLDIYNQTAAAEAWWDGIYVGLSTFDYPVFDETKICANVAEDINVSPAVAIDSAGIFIDSTVFSVGPVAADTNINYQYPFFEVPFDDNNGTSAVWGGNMFDITAHKEIVIYGFDININVSATASAKVYYRKGTHVGFTGSNAGWILLDSVDVVPNPNNGPTWMGLTKSLTIPAGELYGIYICSSNGIDYTTGTGTNEIVSNGDITCQCGYGGAYFSLANTPRVWNGRIYYKVAEEHKESQIMTTLFASNNAYNGNMFDVSAKNDIVIDSLDVNIIADGWVKLYVRTGTVVGNNTSNVGWSLVDSVVVVASGQDIPTRVPLSNRILLQAGNLYGLYVCSAGGMRYTNIIAGTNDVYNDSNMVLTGHFGGSNAFSCTSSRVWNGTLYYSVRNVDAVDLSAQSSTYSSDNVRGYTFNAPTDFMLTGLRVPDDNPGLQYVEVLKFNYPYTSTSVSGGNFVSLARTTMFDGNAICPINVFVRKGDHIGVFGYRKDGANTPINSYGVVSPDTVSILGFNTEIARALCNNDIFYSTPLTYVATYWSGDVPRVEMFVEPVTLHGGPDSVLIDVQTPAPDLGADGDYCVQNIVTLDPGTFASYDWSTLESTATIDVDTAGVPLNTPFDVSVTVTDSYGCTGSDTITITFIDCTGIEENGITLSIYPNPSDDVFYLKADNVQDEMLIQVFSLDGRLVKQQILNETFGNIDMSNELPGVYSIRITVKDQVREMRVVLQ